MKGDFSRDTFDPLKHFSRVLEQQGRVRVDADSNEQTAILLHYLRTLVTDLIGPYAGPESLTGFEIGAIDNKDFSIGRGHYYVDGILCENEAVNLTYNTQKEDYPNPPELEGDGPYLVYLDVWERHITALEDDYIREKALGGPDTASRAKVVWQVKIDAGDENDEDDSLIPTSCKDIHNNWDDWVNRWQPDNRGLLKARVKRPEDSTDPCLTAPDAKYRGQENQLYRIEIHQGSPARAGQANKATFKWSRDNGSVVCRVLEKLSDTELSVEKPLGFEPGIWIELSNDEQELRGKPGSLVKLIKVEGDRFTLEAQVSTPDDAKEDKDWPTKVRRWDGVMPVAEGQGEDDWLEIENGIEIQFNPPPAGKEPHNYRTGDYWLIPARVATGDIEWPVKMNDNGKPMLVNGNTDPIEKKPVGIQHHYAPLAILTPDTDKPHDCRCLITITSSCIRDGE